VAAALAQKERFVASVCHDVQQPLTVILAQSQLLQRQLARGETLPPEQPEHGSQYLAALSSDCQARLASGPAKSPAGPTPAGLGLQLGLHAYQVGRQHAEPAPPMHNWGRRSRVSCAPGAPVKITLAGAGFPKPAHWGVQKPTPLSWGTAWCPTYQVDTNSNFLSS
jgi:hypothetical protein